MMLKLNLPVTFKDALEQFQPKKRQAILICNTGLIIWVLCENYRS